MTRTFFSFLMGLLAVAVCGSCSSNTPSGTGGEEEEVLEKILDVSSSVDIPPALTLARGSTDVTLLSADFTAPEDSVHNSGLVIHRDGVGAMSDWDAFNLYDGTDRLEADPIIDGDRVVFLFSLAHEAGSTKTIRLVGDVSVTAGAANQHAFSIAEVGDIITNAVIVSGNFPIRGNAFTIAGSVDGPPDSECGNMGRGDLASRLYQMMGFTQCASQQIEAACSDIPSGTALSCHWAVLETAGVFSQTDQCRPSDSLNRAEFSKISITASDGLADYETPEIDTFTDVLLEAWFYDYVEAVVQAVRKNDPDAYIGYVDQAGVPTGKFGPGDLASVCWAEWVLSKITFPAPLVEVDGKVIVVNNGPASSLIRNNSTNNHLLVWSMTANKYLTVRNTDLVMALTVNGVVSPTLGATLGSGITDGGGGEMTTASFCLQGNTSGVDNPNIEVGDTLEIPTPFGTEYEIVTSITDSNNWGCIATHDDIVTTNALHSMQVLPLSDVIEVNPYQLIQVVLVKDLGSSSTLQGPMTRASDGEQVQGPFTGHVYERTFTEDYELIGGDTRHLGFLVDTNWNMPDGYQLTATIDFLHEGYIKDLAFNEDVPIEDIVGGRFTSQPHTTVVAELTVSKAAVPVSQTRVKGESNVPSLGAVLTSGLAGETATKKMFVRVYADSMGGIDFSQTGDRAANTVMSSVILMDDANNVVAGPEALTLVDVTGNGVFDPDSGDYYRAPFDSLSLLPPAGVSRGLIPHANLLNTMSSTVYYAMDLVPATDIVAEDEDANTLSAQGGALNGSVGSKNPEITVLKSGSLQANAQGSPDGGIVIIGSNGNLASRYCFHATHEAWTQDKLTVINNLSGDFDFAEDTEAIGWVTLRYPDINGVTQTRSAPMVGGSHTFTSLGFYTPKDESACVELLVDASPVALSGTTFRVGIKGQGNSVSTFEAIGQFSSEADYFEDGDEILNQYTVNTFVVRKTKPTFALETGLNTALVNGENRWMGTVVSADSAGKVIIEDQIFEFISTGSLTTTNHRMYKGNTLLSAGFAFVSNQATVTLTVPDGDVYAGTSETYGLESTIMGAVAGNTFTTRLIGVRWSDGEMSGIDEWGLGLGNLAHTLTHN